MVPSAYHLVHPIEGLLQVPRGRQGPAGSDGCIEVPRVWDPIGQLLSSHLNQHFEVFFFLKAWAMDKEEYAKFLEPLSPHSIAWRMCKFSDDVYILRNLQVHRNYK